MTETASKIIQPVKSPPHRKLRLKHLWVGLGVVGILSVAAAGTIWMKENLDGVREYLAAGLSEATGLEVRFEDLKMDWSQGFGLRAEGVTVKSKHGNRRLFSTGAVFLRGRWKPLLRGRFKVEEAVFIQPVVEVYPPPPARAAPPANPSPGPNVQRAPAPRGPRLPDLKELLAGLAFEAKVVKVRDALLIWHPSAEEKTGKPIRIRASWNLKVERPGPENVDVVLTGLTLASGPLALAGKIRMFSEPGEPPQIEAFLRGKVLKFSDLKTLGPVVSRTLNSASRRFKLKGTIGSWSFHGKAPLDSLMHWDQLKREMECDAEIQLAAASFQAGDRQTTLGPVHFKGQWARGRLDHTIQTRFWDGDAVAYGAVTLFSEDSQDSLPHIKTTVLWNGLNLADMKGAWPWFPLQGRVSATSEISGPLAHWRQIEVVTQLSTENLVLNPPSDHPEWRMGFPVLEGTVRLANGQVEHDLNGVLLNWPVSAKGKMTFPKKGKRRLPQVQSLIKVDHLPPRVFKKWVPEGWSLHWSRVSGEMQVQGTLDRIRDLTAHGRFSGRKLLAVSRKSPHLKIPVRQMSGEFEIKDDLLKITSLHLQPHHGSIDLHGQYGLMDRSYEVKFSSRKMQVEDFHPQRLDGRFHTSGRFTGSIPYKGYSLRRLNGWVRVKASNGRLHDFETAKSVLAVLNPGSSDRMEEDGLPYKILGGDFVVRQGILTTKNLELVTEGLKIYLQGEANLVKNKVEMAGRCMPSRSLDNFLQAIPILGNLLTAGGQGGLIEARFTVSGSMARPDVSVNPMQTLLGKGVDIMHQLLEMPANLLK